MARIKSDRPMALLPLGHHAPGLTWWASDRCATVLSHKLLETVIVDLVVPGVLLGGTLGVDLLCYGTGKSR